jgi:Fic family protein
VKPPMPPPALAELLRRLRNVNSSRPSELLMGVMDGVRPPGPYLPWDQMRRRPPPDGLTLDEWWLLSKFQRNSIKRRTPLLDKDGREFTYALPDEVLRGIDEVNRNASGIISISEQVTNPATRDRYLVNSLIEEAITSSQLEGASTERGVAKEMIRSGRRPKTRDERMIFNNYNAMQRVRSVRDEELSPELICEIQKMVTDGTLDNPDASGRFQLPSEERVAVFSNTNSVLHEPPPAHELPERARRLCDFANGRNDEDLYIPPVLRAITVHFMLSYDHPFEDGNGRTARALFYWSMLRQDYWLTEFLAISKILRGAPSRYAYSFLHTEQDDNDLTYFHIYQLNVIQRSIRELHEYLARKMDEIRGLQRSLAMLPGEFNHRQIALLENAVRRPGQIYTTVSHSSSHNVTVETARRDLTSLADRGLLDRTKIGHANAWAPHPDIADRLDQRLNASNG